jgi:glutathione S-transferase
MRRLDQLVPDPPLFPADADARARVEEAEGWGDEVLQPIGRQFLWAGFSHAPDAMVSYAEHSRLPLPASAVKLSAPLIAALASRLNHTNDDVVRSDLSALPGQLDKIDAWIDDGTLGDSDHPNAAALQIAATIRLLMTVADVRPLIAGRPIAKLAMALFPQYDGEMPVGTLPAA